MEQIPNPNPFTVDRGTVFKTLLLSSATGWPIWSALCVGLFLIVVGGIFDIRWLVIGLMIWLAVIPAIAVFIFFSNALAPEIVANLLPHTLVRNEDGYDLLTFRHVDDEEDPESEVSWEQSGSISLSDSNILKKKTTFEYEILFFKDSPMRILYIPRI